MKKDRNAPSTYYDGGFTAQGIDKDTLQSIKVSGLAHFYHKPYENDWLKASRKAKISRMIMQEVYKR